MVIKQNVGIDVSKDRLDVCFRVLEQGQEMKIKGSRHFSNQAKGFSELLEWAKKKSVDGLELHVTLEATGVYYEDLAYYLHQQGLVVHVVLPNKVHAYAQSLNLKTKTDKTAAQMLGRLGLERQLQVWKPLSPLMRRLKKLSRERSALIEDRTAVANRLHAETHSHQPEVSIMRRLRQQIKLIDRQIAQVEEQLKKLVQGEEWLAKKFDKILAVKGIGFITLVTIVAETDGFVLFRNRAQLVSYAGYDVVERQSGSSVLGKTRISKKGNRYIRRVLHFPALTLIQYNEHYRDLYERVYERTKIKMKGAVAVQRKLLTLIYTLWKTDAEYDPNYHKDKVHKLVPQKE